MDATGDGFLTWFVAVIITMAVMEILKLVTRGKLGKKGSLNNKLLPIIAVAVGVGVVIMKMWWVGMEFRTEEGWNMLVAGLQTGVGAGGLRSMLKAFGRSET